MNTKKEHLFSNQIYKMIIFSFIIGMLLPSIIGWLILRLIEGETPVLFRVERITLGIILGTTLTTFLFFLANTIDLISFTRNGFLLVCILSIVLLTWLFMRMKVHWPKNQPIKFAMSPPLSNKIKIIIGVFGMWILFKIITASVLLIGSPPYLDDTLKNWNMRGKVYFVAQDLVLSPHGNSIANSSPEGIFSYPPTVPLVKTFLASIAGSWNEGLINAPHILWYIVSLLLMFFFLRRHLNIIWSLGGMYLLSSLPLYLIHGAQAYADLYLSIHIFAAIYLLFNAIKEENEKRRICFLHLSGFSAALLAFTKNEALLLHAPIYVLVFMLTIFFMKQSNLLTTRQMKKVVLNVFLLFILIALPWLIFKWMNNLTFGNAKAISGLGIGWQPGVLRTLWLNTFFEANWLFLFPLLISLLIIRWKKIFLSPLALLAVFFILVFGQQICLYMFTSLSTEAIRQTGYGRGIAQLIPIAVALIIFVLKGIWNRE
ncbi:MAG: glycosyltransferase family 39 protein [Candidatus Peribacteraceae bacterium]|nr:glycosyltransferase family 39 protein [Candidatus Peribacteraceae bacterium]